MQVQKNNGLYEKPKVLDKDILSENLKCSDVKRILVFAAYGEDGKPTAELRRAWRRYKKIKQEK